MNRKQIIALGMAGILTFGPTAINVKAAAPQVRVDDLFTSTWIIMARWKKSIS